MWNWGCGVHQIVMCPLCKARAEWLQQHINPTLQLPESHSLAASTLVDSDSELPAEQQWPMEDWDQLKGFP